MAWLRQFINIFATFAIILMVVFPLVLGGDTNFPNATSNSSITNSDGHDSGYKEKIKELISKLSNIMG